MKPLRFTAWLLGIWTCVVWARMEVKHPLPSLPNVSAPWIGHMDFFQAVPRSLADHNLTASSTKKEGASPSSSMSLRSTPESRTSKSAHTTLSMRPSSIPETAQASDKSTQSKSTTTPHGKESSSARTTSETEQVTASQTEPTSGTLESTGSTSTPKRETSTTPASSTELSDTTSSRSATVTATESSQDLSSSSRGQRLSTSAKHSSSNSSLTTSEKAPQTTTSAAPTMAHKGATTTKKQPSTTTSVKVVSDTSTRTHVESTTTTTRLTETETRTSVSTKTSIRHTTKVKTKTETSTASYIDTVSKTRTRTSLSTITLSTPTAERTTQAASGHMSATTQFVNHTSSKTSIVTRSTYSLSTTWPTSSLSNSKSAKILTTSTARASESMPTSIVQGSSGAKEPTFSGSKELESFKYQFVNTDTLLLSRTQPSSSSTGNGRSKASPATAKGTTLTFPDPMAVTSTPGAQSTMSMTLSPQELQLPKSIVPNGTEPTPNETMVLISILFKNDMDWSWVVAQRATTAQIFTYMPKIIAYAIRGREDDVQTVQLRQFQNESSVNASYRVMYLAYLDKNMGLALKHAIQDPSSSFYHAPFGPVSQQLAAEVDSSFSLFSYSSVPLSEAKDLSPVTKKALIGCFAGVGGLLVLGLVVWLVLKNKKRSRCALKRTDTINSFGNTIDPVSTLSIATSSSTLQEGSSDGGMPSRVTSRSETLDDPFRGPLSSRTVETDPFSTPYPVRHTSISAGRRWLHSNHTANSYEGDQPTSRDQLIPHVQTIAHASNMGSM